MKFLYRTVVVVVVGVAGAVASDTPCCQTLRETFPTSVAVRSDIRYNTSIASYWSTQAATVHPACIFYPSTTEEVSQAIAVLNDNSLTSCPFVVRGGGHTPFAGFNNVENGITIELRGLNDVVIAQDELTVSVGGGALWGEVYPDVVARGKILLGGRLNSVGVPGLTTGGGLSFITPRYGFVADGVKNFQVVLANATIVDANETTHSDLYKALKGGQGNFGIITRFDFSLYDQGEFWQGRLVHNISDRDAVFAAFQSFTDTLDLDAALLSSFTLVNRSEWISANTLIFAKPVAAGRYPTSYTPFYEIPAVSSSNRTANLTSLVDADGDSLGPKGYRWSQATALYVNNATMMANFLSLANATANRLPEDPATSFQVVYQPLTTHMVQQSRSTGGSSFGLDDLEENHCLYVVTLRWSKPELDAVFESLIRELMTASDAIAQEMGLYHPFKYLNYAASWQNPIASYGTEMVKQLWATSKRYDPTRVFQTRVGGGFKLPLM